MKVLKDEHIGNGLARRDLVAEIQIVRRGPWGPIRGAPNRPRTRKQRMHWPSINLQLACPRCTSGQMADLHHPGVLALMGAGETPDRKVPTARHTLASTAGNPESIPTWQPFVVLQQLKETLASTLPRSGSSYFAREAALKRWSLTRALQCGLELADALRYLHDEAISGFFILHRDIKPDNLGFLADGKLVLFDFGLAKLCKVDPNEAPGAGRTLTGEVGTPRYMAPEVACSRPYGVAAETYSFSILLWQARLPACSHASPALHLCLCRHLHRTFRLSALLADGLARVTFLRAGLAVLPARRGGEWAAAAAQEELDAAALRAPRRMLAGRPSVAPVDGASMRPAARDNQRAAS